MTKEDAKKEIEKLVERFREHREEYHLPEYNETKTRQDFVNPFFKALGWDMDNTGEASEVYREVIHEDKVKVYGKMKAPDYGFRLLGSGDKRLFFVEAKKPSVLLKVSKEPAFQIRRYGLSAQTPVSILTNFEEFVVYDCTKKPNFNDAANVARIKHISFEDYLKEFDFIYDTFSHEAVVKGRFDKFVKSDTYKKGSQTLDKYFVETLNEWRTYLATSIARNNLQLIEDDINFVVQLTIDRLIFLRFCEDRGVEHYGQLQDAIKSGDIYQNLFHIFKQADEKYNSGLFDFEKDKLSQNLKVDNKILKTIVGEMYYPKSSYDFRIMPVEIIGNAYEQFLGKVIRITKGHHAVIEEKPEVRKAGGVYYTPQYIVNYIVANTVGKLVEGKTPKEIEKIKIVDPACGSGSFLIGAFQFLLDYHVKWYTDHASAKTMAGKRNSPLTPDGKLTGAEKKKILLNNIYGVDIDTNAVEVSKLSLLLKCMEGETEASIKQQLSVFHERVLPDLDNNIKSGNSLIDTDFYDSEFELGFEKKIKPFNWQKGFPEVFKQGGFDAVIGNPPYIPIEIFNVEEKNYYKKRFPVLSRKYDSSVLFILRGFNLIKENGSIGYISTQTWQTGENYDQFRKKIIQNHGVVEIINLPFNVFKEAYVDTGIFIFSKMNQPTYSFYSYDKKVLIDEIGEINFKRIQISDVKKPDYKLILHSTITQILSKLNSTNFIPLGEISISTQGLSASRFPTAKSNTGKWILPFINATVKRYSFINESQHWVDLDAVKSLYKFYLEEEKILIRRIINRQDRIDATYFNQKGVFKKDLNPFIITDNNYSTKYILGILNSKLFSWLYINSSSIATKDDFRQTTLSELRKLQIRKLGLNNPEDKKYSNEIVKHVDLLLKLNAELQEAKLPEKIEQLKSRIAYSEDKINELVYELYGLSEEEIKIVEEK